MKIKTGRLVDGDVISTYSVAIWTAAGWILSNTDLGNELVHRAYTAAGITSGPKYRHKANVQGAPKWDFSIVITRQKWEEVTK